MCDAYSFFRGFKFGMLLQVAVGPVCFFILHNALSYGFWLGFGGALGAAAADALFMVFSIIGMGVLRRKYPATMSILRIAGVVLLWFFGARLIFGSVGDNAEISRIALEDASFFKSLYLTFFLTLANPLTLLFWTGFFAAKIAQESLKIKNLCLFSAGCIAATIIFLTIISALGSVTGHFISIAMTRTLNIVVGVLLLFYGCKMLIGKSGIKASEVQKKGL